MAANQLWRWRALTKDGEPRSGTLWATDRNAAFTRLMRNDLHPLTLTRCAQRHRWRPHHCDEMFHQLATLLQAGLTLSHSLQMLAEQHPSKPWQALLQSIADELSEGCTFSESLKKWPVDSICRQLAQQQKAQQQLSAKVKKALRYPAIVLTLAVLVVLAMVTLVLPEFAAIYKTFNTPLPVLTQMVMGMAAFMQSYALALFTLLLAPLAVAWALRQNPRWQCILLHTPVMGALAKGQKLGHVFTVLSLTQQAGIPFLQGLESAEETVESQYWQGILRGVREDIEKGLPVWSSFQRAAIFTPLCVQLLRTGEMSGALDIMLANLARHHTEQTFQRAENLAALLEPVLLIVTGVIIGTLVVAMYLPIFHLGDAMSAG